MLIMNMMVVLIIVLLRKDFEFTTAGLQDVTCDNVGNRLSQQLDYHNSWFTGCDM